MKRTRRTISLRERQMRGMTRAARKAALAKKNLPKETEKPPLEKAEPTSPPQAIPGRRPTPGSRWIGTLARHAWNTMEKPKDPPKK